MPSRRPSLSWSARRDRFGCATRWAPGSIRSPAARRLVSGRPPSDGASTSGVALRRIAARSVEVGTPRDPDRDAAVHEEVNRLPEKYRAPVVLCDLEGRTHQEAARFLGWPIGTVKSRQAQGRGLLRDRLVRRGLGLAVAGAVVESLRQTAFAAMPKEVSRSTVNAAMQQSARLLTGFGVSAHVLSLTQGVLRAMLWIRLRFLIGRHSCGRDRLRRSERLRTWLSGASAEGRTAGLEGAIDQDCAGPTAEYLEASDGTTGGRRGAGETACAATGHAKGQSLL